MSSKVRVLVVDDSALMRKLIPQILERDDSIEVVGTAMDGSFGLKKIEELKADADAVPTGKESHGDLAQFYFDRGNARAQLGRLAESIARRAHRRVPQFVREVLRIERAQLDETQAAARRIGRIELVDAEFGAVRAARHVCQQMTEEAVRHAF